MKPFSERRPLRWDFGFMTRAWASTLAALADDRTENEDICGIAFFGIMTVGVLLLITLWLLVTSVWDFS